MILLNIITDVLPIGPDQWDDVCACFNEQAGTNRNVMGIRCKFTQLHRRRIKTGDPDCPDDVKQAKRALRAIEHKSNVAVYNGSRPDVPSAIPAVGDGVVLAAAAAALPPAVNANNGAPVPIAGDEASATASAAARVNANAAGPKPRGSRV